jgi:hypothetical protein
MSAVGDQMAPQPPAEPQIFRSALSLPKIPSDLDSH